MHHRRLRIALIQNLDNPFQWFAGSPIPKAALRKDTVQYYFEASDGFSRMRSAELDVPHKSEIVNEFDLLFAPVPPQGGSIMLSDGAPQTAPTLLEFLAGVSAEPFQIQTHTLGTALLGRKAIGACKFIADRLIHFQTPARLPLRYNDKNLDIFWWNGVEWRYVGGEAQKLKQAVQTPVTHLSIFALFPTAEFKDFTAKENIITPGLRDGINNTAVLDGLGSLSEHYSIHLFDLNGREVRTIEDSDQWDGKNSGGNMVKRGVRLPGAAQWRILSGTITVAR